MHASMHLVHWLALCIVQRHPRFRGPISPAALARDQLVTEPTSMPDDRASTSLTEASRKWIRVLCARMCVWVCVCVCVCVRVRVRATLLPRDKAEES